MSQTNEMRNLRRKMKRHLDALASRDADFAAGLKAVGYPDPRVRPAGFETFLNIIDSQQISTEAARSISARVAELLPRIDAAAVLVCSEKQLRRAGLSGRKVEYVRGLAEAIDRGEFDVDELGSLDDESAIEQIVKLRGFGRWSAEIYLMFSLGRRDVFPADDLALQLALQRLKDLPDRPTPAKAREETAHWKPYRSAASVFLWHYYRGAPA